MWFRVNYSMGSSLDSDCQSIIMHFSHRVLYIQCSANHISKETIFSLCQALQKLAARLIVTQEGLYPTAVCLFSVAAHRNQWPLVSALLF